jgi:L-asparagine transporter-like permease
MSQFSVDVYYHPYYVGVIIDFFLFFLPIVGIMFLGFYIVVLLSNIHRKKREMRRKMSNMAKNQSSTSQISMIIHFIHILTRLGPETKFQFIIVSYWIQWLPLLLIYLFYPFCECVPENIIHIAYWLSYSASMTNPIMVLLFNSNISFSCN